MKTIKYYKKSVFWFSLIILLTAQNIISQVTANKFSDRKILPKIQNADRSEFRYIPKKPGHYTKEDWRKVIDSTWGEGLSTTKKLQLFDRFWNDVDKYYPSFFNLNVNWDSLKSVYRPEIEAGVSRGRFAAIMSKMSYSLGDLHTYIRDLLVATDSLKAGVPIFVTSGYQSMFNREMLDEEYCHFGASLSLFQDSSLLVYDVISNHPLGLERGDIILGYDGIPWKKLYKELLNAELPFYEPGTIGSNPKSIEHLLLTSAGENWHLFDSIDIVKNTINDTIHLPTSLLENKKMQLLSTTQLPIPNIPFPDIDHGHWVSSGVIGGTNIGYIYVWNWTSNGDFPYQTTPTGVDFKNAINSLINNYNINGLIIDSRYNTGGQFSEFAQGMKILFNEDQDNFKGYCRNNTNDHYSMKLYTGSTTGNITKNITTRYLFDEPIAILTGPFSISCGDFMPLQMTYHPMTKAFGFGTNGAFGTIETIDISNISADWKYHRTVTNFKLNDNYTNYLTHLYFPPNEEVWFTKANVVLGKDDVVEKALEWINNLVYGHELTLDKNYCNPNTDFLNISTTIENPNDHKIKSKLYIKNLDESFTDSLELYKISVINNSEIWTGNYFAPNIKDYFKISIKALDETDSNSWVTKNAVRFTTIGPLTVDSISYWKDPRGSVMSITPYVNNRDSTKIITKPSIKITINDPWCEAQGELKLPDIDPNTTVGTSNSLNLVYDESTFPGYFNMQFEIKSDGWTYWKDSTQLNITDIRKEYANLSTKFELQQNYPNPFNPSTTIKYSIPSNVKNEMPNVKLAIYDVLGREIATLVNIKQKPGNYEVEWNASEFPSGVYFYKLQVGNFIETKKMLLIK